jgi:hypothetical protein
MENTPNDVCLSKANPSNSLRFDIINSQSFLEPSLRVLFDWVNINHPDDLIGSISSLGHLYQELHHVCFKSFSCEEV